jgi:transcriptional regulator with XRE-family HTH domain
MLDPSKMSERLSALRAQKGLELGRKLTQVEAATEAGVSRGHLAGAERGHTGISLDAAYRLADYYETTLDYLAGRAIAALEPPGGILQTAEERALLRGWRALNHAEKEAVRTLVDRLSRVVDPHGAA